MPKKGKVRGNSGGVAALTCKSFVIPQFFWRNTNLPISQLLPSAVSLRTTETEQLHQAKRMIGGNGNMLFTTDSQI